MTPAWAQEGRYWLWGRGFGDAEILAGGKLAQVTGQSKDEVEFLIPQDASPGEDQARLGAHGSPFQPIDIGVAVREAAPAFLGSGGREITWLHEDGVTPVTAANPARLDETVTARMTGMGPVDDAGSTTVVFQWSLIEWYMPSHMGPAFWRTPLELIRSQATGEPGVYRVTVRLPQVFRFGISSCLGIDAAVAGGGFQRSLLPLRVP